MQQGNKECRDRARSKVARPVKAANIRPTQHRSPILLMVGMRGLEFFGPSRRDVDVGVAYRWRGPSSPKRLKLAPARGEGQGPVLWGCPQPTIPASPQPFGPAANAGGAFRMNTAARKTTTGSSSLLRSLAPS